jgi:single-stranded-DNA-specific exonuclease
VAISPLSEWILAETPHPEAMEELRDFNPLERQLLFSRGISQIHQAEMFLDPDYSESHDPNLLLGMDSAVQRIQKAKRGDERIIVYGDYDADGTTAIALLLNTFNRMGIQADWYLPDRFSEGYGLNTGAIERFAENGVDLIVTVDCGIRAVEEVAFAREKGIDVIITDHHLPGEEIPSAPAIINPNLPEDPYPNKGLAGVGVAYKLSHALHTAQGMAEPTEFLDLVAIGTVADVVSLLGENRSFVQRGLKRMNHGPLRLGLAALISRAGLGSKSIDASTIGYGIGPRLNAAGRLSTADYSVRLLLTRDEKDAREFADTLERINRERRKLTSETQSFIAKKLKLDQQLPDMIFTVEESFHEGVIGLSATKIVNQYYRPTVIARSGTEITKGSARSIPEFHITDALSKCSDILLRFGGHQMAAGFSVDTNRVSELEHRLLDQLHEVFPEEMPVPKLQLDALVAFPQLDEELLKFMDQLEPFGMENPKPLFGAKGVEVLDRRMVGASKKHLKLLLKQEGRKFDSIAFNQGDLYSDAIGTVDIAFHFERNHYQGVTTQQLNILEIQS